MRLLYIFFRFLFFYLIISFIFRAIFLFLFSSKKQANIHKKDKSTKQGESSRGNFIDAEFKDI